VLEEYSGGFSLLSVEVEELGSGCFQSVVVDPLDVLNYDIINIVKYFHIHIVSTLVNCNDCLLIDNCISMINS